MKIALVTCADLPNGVDDDLPLLQALKGLGLDASFEIWDQNLDWSEFDGLVLRSVWDYHERHAEFMVWMQQVNTQTRLFNPLPMVDWNSSKHYLKDLASFGIAIAPTQWLKRGADLAPLALDSTVSQYFLKPVIGADSSGTLRFENTKTGRLEADAHLEQWLPDHDMMLQPYLSSVETHGETSGIFFAGEYSHGTRKIPVKGDYRVQDTFGAADIPHRLNAAERALSQAAIEYITERFGLPLYARFDFLQGEDGVVYMNEAELIEPSLFFNHGPKAAKQYAQAIQRAIANDAS